MVLTHEWNEDFDGVRSYAHQNSMSDVVLLIVENLARPMLNSWQPLLPRISQFSEMKSSNFNKCVHNLMSAICFNMKNQG